MVVGMSKLKQYANSNYNYHNMSEFEALNIAYTALSADHKKLRYQLGELVVQLKGVKDRDQLMLQLMQANDMILRLSKDKEQLEEQIEYLSSLQVERVT
jgi:hypothetical protein